MALRLVVIDGADEGRFFPLSDGVIQVIGNSRRNTDICLHDLLASRVHCQVEVEEDRVVVTDMDDSTGTFVNGQKVRQQELRLGDVIRVGNSFLRLQQDDAENGDLDTVEEVAEEEAVVELAELPQLTADRLEELSGYTLGHFDVGPVLGKGFHGVTFRARDTKVDRMVALKVLSPDFPKNEEEMQRFVKVLKPMLPLQHPNLVSIYGAGKNGPYIWVALEFVDGENLTGVIQRLTGMRKIDWRRAFHVCLHLARALEFAHKHHLVHRNVTPNNVLWKTDEKVAKLNDLFLSRALHGSLVKQVALRQKIEAELVYLAPEQTNSPAYVDGLSDLYSVGVITYTLLTGQPLFEGKAMADVVRQIRETKPVKPTEYQPNIPEEFERVVMKMLRKRQEDRYQTASELLGELEQVGEEEGVAV